MEDYGKAEKFLLEAIAKNDKDAEAAYILGRPYLELKNEKSAIPQFQKAVELESGRSQRLFELKSIVYKFINDVIENKKLIRLLPCF